MIATLAVVGNLLAQECPGGQKPTEPTRRTQQGAQTPPMTKRQMPLLYMAQHTEELGRRIRESNRWME